MAANNSLSVFRILGNGNCSDYGRFETRTGGYEIQHFFRACIGFLRYFPVKQDILYMYGLLIPYIKYKFVWSGGMEYGLHKFQYVGFNITFVTLIGGLT